MKEKSLPLVMLGMLLFAVTLYSHHSFTATYEVGKTLRVEGKIAQLVFRNPHSYVHVLAPDENGTMQRWAVEWRGAGQLAAQGIVADTLNPGDPVVVTGDRGRDPTEHRIRMITLERTTDGFTWGTRPGEVVD